MAYSGTFNSGTFDTQKTIDRALRLCKVKPQQITGEMQLIAQEILFLQLRHLPNKGLQSWTIQKQLIGLPQGQPKISATDGTIDILNANWRLVQRVTDGSSTSSTGIATNAFDGDFTTACIETAPNGWIAYDFGTATQITTVGILFYGAQWLKLLAQVSSDNSTWTTVYQTQPSGGNTAIEYADSDWLWFDVPRAQQFQYFRIIETSGGTLAVRELVLGNRPQEIPLARLNRDDYENLPNKYYPGRPAQYWLDREANSISMNVFPVTDSTNRYGHISMRVKRQIMDVGSLTQELELPYRWYDALCYRLASELGKELPEVSEGMAQSLEMNARAKENEAQTEDRDNSPIYIQPSIGVYTR